jgi:hypothetical protein
MSSCSTDSKNSVGEHCVKGVRAVTAVVEVAGESRRRGSARGSARGGARLLSSLWGSFRTLGRQTDPVPTVTDSSVTGSKRLC